MVQATFVAATLTEPFTGRTGVFSGSSASNATAWYIYNQRND